MYRADKFYGSDRQVLANISLLPAGAKIGVLGPNGAGKSTLLRIMAGLEDPPAGSPELALARASACWRRSRSSTRSANVRENVEDGVRELRDLLDRFNAVSAAFAEPDADFDALLAEQAKVQDQIDRADAWNLDATLDRAMDALRLPDGDRDVTTLSGASAAASPSAGCFLSSRPAPPGRADEPPRRRVGRLARAVPGVVQGHRRRRHPRPLLPRQRRRLDPRARPRQGIPFEGNYSSWLEQKQARLAVEEKPESARRRTLARELEWVRASPKARHAKAKARVTAYEKLLAEEKNVGSTGSRSTSRGPASATSSSTPRASRRASATACSSRT